MRADGQQITRESSPASRGLTLGTQVRNARPADGRAVHQLVQEVGGLERNTGYAYLLLCDHFGATTLVAESDEGLVGFVAAYAPPERSDAMFVWQIGVHPAARGTGLGSTLLDTLLSSGACRQTRFLEATVTPSNAGSRRLFESFATRHGADFQWSDGYPASFFESGHEPEQLIRVGPLTRIAAPGSPSTPQPNPR